MALGGVNVGAILAPWQAPGARWRPLTEVQLQYALCRSLRLPYSCMRKALLIPASLPTFEQRRTLQEPPQHARPQLFSHGGQQCGRCATDLLRCSVCLMLCSCDAAPRCHQCRLPPTPPLSTEHTVRPLPPYPPAVLLGQALSVRDEAALSQVLFAEGEPAALPPLDHTCEA